MKRLLYALSILPALPAAKPCGEIILATTTSTQDTGLLDSLLPMFKRETCIEVKPIAVGTGAALEMAKRGDADAVLVHAPEAEKAYVESGDLIGGRLIMHKGEPLADRGQNTLGEALSHPVDMSPWLLRPHHEGSPRAGPLTYSHIDI